MIIDCLSISKNFDAGVQAAVQRLRDGGSTPRMCEILATHSEGTLSYSATKKRKAHALGIEYEPLNYSQEVHFTEIVDKITQLNANPEVHGILIGMPMYSHLDSEKLIATIDASKDVDGLGPTNSYFVFSNQEHLGIAPATAVAVVHILETRFSLRGRSVAVVGRGRTVGRPVGAMLTNRDATVTVCHSRTPKPELERIVRNSEILIAATGTPGVVRSEWFSRDQTVVDCGIAIVNGKTVGDLNSAEVSDRGAFVTPVPKGVGVVTNSMIFGNLLQAVKLKSGDGR